MKKRSKLSHRRNKKVFRKGLKSEMHNVAPRPMRGGYRM